MGHNVDLKSKPCMDHGPSARIDLQRQRNAGMFYIAIAAPVAIGLWLGVDHFMPPLAGMDA